MRIFLLVCVLSIAALVPSAVPSTSAAPSSPSVLGNYDIRVFGGDQLTSLLTVYAPAGMQNTTRIAGAQAAAMLRGTARLKGAVPGADVRFSHAVWGRRGCAE